MTNTNELTAKLRHWASMASVTSERVSCLSVEQLTEVIEALEAAQRDREHWRISFDNERLRADKLKEAFEQETSYRECAFIACNRWHDKFREEEAKLEAAEKRIAELEARTVKLPKRSVVEVMLISGFGLDYAEGWCSGNDNARHEVQLAGIKLQIEGE